MQNPVSISNEPRSAHAQLDWLTGVDFAQSNGRQASAHSSVAAEALRHKYWNLLRKDFGKVWKQVLKVKAPAEAFNAWQIECMAVHSTRRCVLKEPAFTMSLAKTYKPAVPAQSH